MSWVNGESGYSLKLAYLAVTSSLRAAMTDSGRSLVMLMNTVGYSCLSFMQPFDGTFSEVREGLLRVLLSFSLVSLHLLYMA